MKNFVNFRTVLFIALSLMLGICFGYFLFLSKILGAIISIVLFLLVVISVLFFTGRETKIFKTVLSFLLILFATFGALSFTLRANAFNSSTLDGRYASVKGRIVDVRENSGYLTYILSDIEFVSLNSHKSRYKLKLISYDIEGGERFSVGDIITFNDTIACVPLVYNGKFSSCNVVNKIKHSASLSSNQITKVGFYQTIFERASSRIKEVYKRGLGDGEQGVATALILGDTGGIEGETLDNFRASGVAHIFAVSGLHIGFLSTFLFFIFRRFKIKEWLKAFIITLVIFFYSGVCGFSPSSLRACITCSVMLISRTISLKYDSLSALSISAVILLCVSPFNLFDVGFILSYVTVLGILLLSSPINRLLFFIKSQKLRNALVLVLSAWVSSAPIIAYYFSNFSVIGVLTNLLFVPIVSVVFIVSFVLTFLAVIFGLESVFLFVPSILLKCVLWVFNVVDFRIFELTVHELNGAIFLYYLALLFCSDIINTRLKTKIISAITALALCATCFFTVRAVDYNRYKAYLYGNSDFGVALFTEKDDAVLYVVGNFGEGTLSIVNSVLNLSGIKELDALIISSSVDLDLISSVYNVAPFSNLYLDVDSQTSATIITNYLGVETHYLTPKDAYSFSGFVFRSNGLGGLEIARKDHKTLMFNGIAQNFSYQGFDTNVDLILALLSPDETTSCYAPNKTLSFNKNDSFDSLEGAGVVKYILNN